MVELVEPTKLTEVPVEGLSFVGATSESTTLAPCSTYET